MKDFFYFIVRGEKLQVKPERWRRIKKTTESKLTPSLTLALVPALILIRSEDQRASHARDAYTTHLLANPSLKTLGASASVEPFIKVPLSLYMHIFLFLFFL